MNDTAELSRKDLAELLMPALGLAMCGGIVMSSGLSILYGGVFFGVTPASFNPHGDSLSWLEFNAGLIGCCLAALLGLAIDRGSLWRWRRHGFLAVGGSVLLLSIAVVRLQLCPMWLIEIFSIVEDWFVILGLMLFGGELLTAARRSDRTSAAAALVVSCSAAAAILCTLWIVWGRGLQNRVSALVGAFLALAGVCVLAAVVMRPGGFAGVTDSAQLPDDTPAAAASRPWFASFWVVTFVWAILAYFSGWASLNHSTAWAAQYARTSHQRWGTFGPQSTWMLILPLAAAAALAAIYPTAGRRLQGAALPLTALGAAVVLMVLHPFHHQPYDPAYLVASALRTWAGIVLLDLMLQSAPARLPTAAFGAILAIPAIVGWALGMVLTPLNEWLRGGHSGALAWAGVVLAAAAIAGVVLRSVLAAAPVTDGTQDEVAGGDGRVPPRTTPQR